MPGWAYAQEKECGVLSARHITVGHNSPIKSLLHDRSRDSWVERKGALKAVLPASMISMAVVEAAAW